MVFLRLLYTVRLFSCSRPDSFTSVGGVFRDWRATGRRHLKKQPKIFNMTTPTTTKSTKDNGENERSVDVDSPLDEVYEPKLIKVQTNDGVMKPVIPEMLREACASGSGSVPVASPGQQSKVLVLYTGGTIGMKVHENGTYAPVSNYLPNALRRLPHLNDQEYVDAHYAGWQIPPCVLPPVKGEDRRVVYWVIEYEPLLDSCDMTFDDWIRIANDIFQLYDQFDGFVILHGTDTLAYTASALSFIFENLGKTIVVTGAQIPVAEVRSDGRENFVGALILAANYDIPEVTVYFSNKLFRGNRTSKLDNRSMEAFNSPNLPPLATVEISINVEWDAIFRSSVPKTISLHTNMNRHVGLLRIFPSITVECVRAFLQPPMEGVVLQTFGAGNISSGRKDLVEALKHAVDRGLLVVNCTQCPRGQVTRCYQTGQCLYDIGVVPGSDMTPEAALTKLAYVLGQEELNLTQKKKWMSYNLRGELSVARNRRFSLQDDDMINRLAKFLHVSTSDELSSLREALYPPLVCAAAGKGDIALLTRLRDWGARLGAADYERRTALHVAAAMGNVDSVKFLLKEGVNVHMKDINDETPFLAAVRRGHLDVIKLLIGTGAHLTLTPAALAVELCLLVSKRDVSALTAWKLAEADFNVTDYDKRTPLHVAASWGYEDVVVFLLECKVSVCPIDAFGNQPINDAVRNGHNAVVELLRNATPANVA